MLGVCSCSEDDNIESIPHPTNSDTITIYPQKIFFTSIDEKIRWNSDNKEAHSPIIVNSKEELLQYVHGQSDFYSGIDFSKNSVLLIHGWSGNGVSDVIVRNFQVLSKTEYFLKVLKTCQLKVETGIFGADMQVKLINDGPVTIWIDSKNKE